MLKIRDGIDLKELEKFGFKYKPYKNEDIEYGWDDGYKNDLEIYRKDVVIELETNWIGDEMLDKLFDLIQAGLVEKVSDE